MVEFGIGGAFEQGGVVETAWALVVMASVRRLCNACNFAFFDAHDVDD